METSLLASLWEGYHLGLSLLAFLGITAITLVGTRLLLLVPTIREAHAVNKADFEKKMEKPSYVAIMKRNRRWGLVFNAFIFFVALPWCLTLDPQPWWKLLLDIAVILMFYDFFYYLTHRYLFHDNGFMGGPLVWVHAVHHRQNNPNRLDASYLHPIETGAGLGLYVASIFTLSQIMGPFHLVTIIFTFVTFTQINLHNHDLWTEKQFPFRYLNYAAQMHHNHHARFTSGNYATISLLYDWLFGTIDHGQGWGKYKNDGNAEEAAAGSA